jgi:hypothetical protein
MESIRIQSTSKSSAITDDIVLRETQITRLIFRPLLIENAKANAASVKGTFIFQRKRKNDSWENNCDLHLSSLKASEWVKLPLKGVELLKLYEQLGCLYKLYRQDGIPYGEQQYVRIDDSLSALLRANEAEFNGLFTDANADGAALISRMLKLLSSSKHAPNELLRQLDKLNVTNLQQIRSIIGITALKASLHIWEANKDNPDEEFWQKTLEENSFVLSQIFAHPIVIVRGKAYVGGKSIFNSGGNLVDFLGKTSISKNAVLIEIKTPTTDLLGKQYRGNSYSISTDLSGAVVQIASYKSSLQNQYQDLFNGTETDISEAFEPTCAVIVGNYGKEIENSPIKKKSLGLFRSHLKDIKVLTYDELFGKVQLLVDLLQGPVETACPAVEDDVPF